MKKFFLMSAAGSGLEKLENTAVGIMEDIQLLLWVAVALALLVNGLFLIIGGEEGRAKAKKSISLGCSRMCLCCRGILFGKIFCW